MRIALLPPSHCSVCFNQDPQAVHVDMEAATDGPMLTSADGVMVSIDDIIVCENCIRRATDLLPEYVQLRDEAIQARVEVARAWEYAETMKKAVDAMKAASMAELPSRPSPARQRPRKAPQTA